MALTDKLTAIGVAIREKTGKTELLTLDQMPTEIASISTSDADYFTDSDLIFGGDCTSMFADNRWQKVLQNEKGRIQIQSPSDISSLFQNSEESDLSHITIKGLSTQEVRAWYPFKNCRNLTKLPVVTDLLINTNNQSQLFQECYRLYDPNELIKFFNNVSFVDRTAQGNYWFRDCYSLRNIDSVMPSIKQALSKIEGYNMNYSGMFYGCYALDEVNNIPIVPSRTNIDIFSHFVTDCCRLKNLTFDTSALTNHFISGSTLDLSNVGYMEYNYQPILIDYNSGITMAKVVYDNATYQALKDDPDWFTLNVNYSRYNHASAVNTINSLPDCSYYIENAGKTVNTIKFKRNAGILTDEGACGALTDEEIAVATAKGWTVTFVD